MDLKVDPLSGLQGNNNNYGNNCGSYRTIDVTSRNIDGIVDY